MPRDLFGDVVVRAPAVRTRRSPVVVASIAAHLVALLAILIASALAPDILPAPRQALAFYEPPRIFDIELPPPPPKPRAAPESRPAAPAVSPNAAPLVAPSAITPETGVEGTDTRASAPVIGVVDGVANLDTFGAVAAPPSAPAAPPPPPARLHSGIVPPRKVLDVTPKYPELARRAQVEGVVILEALIDAGGAAQSARVLRSIPSLDSAALEAVREWRYTPALLNGQPVPVIMTVTVRFTLR